MSILSLLPTGGAIVLVAVATIACERASSPRGPSAPAVQQAAKARESAKEAQEAEERDSNREEKSREVALLAGGCFWGMEEILRDIPGVLETEVGYAGGLAPNPNYETVKTGRSGHAEAVRVVFDPSRLSYEDLLENWFFRMHDPTTEGRQGNDVGSQYRSAIFFTSEEQKRSALGVIKRVNASGKWKDPIVTTVTRAGPFTAAEGYHQDYLQKNPGGYTCHYLRDATL